VNSKVEAVTSFVTRQGWKGQEVTGMYRLNGMLQDFDLAHEFGETVAIASFIKNG
jgi:hypothetical protein